jgi:hypothetical protein
VRNILLLRNTLCQGVASVVARDLAFSQRLFKAFNDLQSAEGGKITQKELGSRVDAVYRRGFAYGQPAVSKWFKGTRPEDPVIRALASVLGCDEEWLLWGDADERPRRRVSGDPR